MSRIPFPIAALLSLGIMMAIGWCLGSWRRTAKTTANATSPERGAMVYQVYCASCHGPEGHGDGSSAAALKPPPRDFASRPWRFEPTPDSIRRVTLLGIPGTGMASFRATLSDSDLEAVTSHVQGLATLGRIVEKRPSEAEQLLKAAKFIDIQGTNAPPLSLIDSKGQAVTLADFKGKSVILHFWGQGCLHCLKEIPALNRLAREHGGKFTILHICVDDESPTVAQKVLDRIAPGTVAMTEANGLGLARYEVHSLPTTWLINADGTAFGRTHEAISWESEAIQKLLKTWLGTVKDQK